jgi:hypothetical protein
MLFDLQTDDLLADAMIENGKKHGDIWDPDYNLGFRCVSADARQFWRSNMASRRGLHERVYGQSVQTVSLVGPAQHPVFVSSSGQYPTHS